MAFLASHRSGGKTGKPFFPAYIPTCILVYKKAFSSLWALIPGLSRARTIGLFLGSNPCHKAGTACETWLKSPLHRLIFFLHALINLERKEKKDALERHGIHQPCHAGELFTKLLDLLDPNNLNKPVIAPVTLVL